MEVILFRVYELKWDHIASVVLDGDIHNPKGETRVLSSPFLNDRWQAVINPQPILPVSAGSA